MATVRMRFHISGGRQVDLENHVFTEWPEAGETLECGDAEAADLIRGGMADPVEPAREAVREPETRTGDDAQEGTQEPAKPARAVSAPRKNVAARD